MLDLGNTNYCIKGSKLILIAASIATTCLITLDLELPSGDCQMQLLSGLIESSLTLFLSSI